MAALNSHSRIIPIIQLFLILPALLFLAAVGVRALQPIQFEPSHTAQLIVNWYVAKIWTLWILLVTLPLLALVLGFASLAWYRVDLQRSQASHGNDVAMLTAAGTLAAFVILIIVALHILAN